MFYLMRNNEPSCAMAMQIPALFEIDARVRVDIWIRLLRPYLSGRAVKWSGTGMRIDDEKFPHGDWLVFGSDDWTPNFFAMSNAKFQLTFEKLP